MLFRGGLVLLRGNSRVTVRDMLPLSRTLSITLDSIANAIPGCGSILSLAIEH
jgi:hypothetical protein